jgi:hypothetical protein
VGQDLKTDFYNPVDPEPPVPPPSSTQAPENGSQSSDSNGSQSSDSTVPKEHV